MGKKSLMSSKGQLVEIPENASIYRKDQPSFFSKKEELLWKALRKNYSLFDGFLVGEHSGWQNFQIGQRKGINVGGKKKPLYVIAIDKAENRVFVGAGDQHPGLWGSVLSFDRNQFNMIDDPTFSSENWKNGNLVSVSVPFKEEFLAAKLYRFDDLVFLDFRTELLLTFQESTLEIFQQNLLIATIF